MVNKMDNYTATELAYQNGYEQGRKDAVQHGWWVPKPQLYRLPNAKNYYCSECREETVVRHNYCPCCGADMDGDAK